MHIHTHIRSCWRERANDTHTHPYLWSYVCTNTHASRGASFIALPGTLLSHTHAHTHTHTHTHVAVYWRFDYWWYTHTRTYTHAHAWLRCIPHFSFTLTGAFPLHACGVTHNWRSYLFHQCATSRLSRDDRIADCTVRHPGVERFFLVIKSS